MKILIVDDSLLVRNSIKRFIKALEPKYEINFLEAKDGQQALDLFEQEKPDLMTLDLLMPILEGTEVLEQIKKNEHHKCFIAIFSSNFQKPLRERLLLLGANLFIDKPASLEKIKNILEECEKFFLK